MAIPVESQLLDQYAGTYRQSFGGGSITFRREGSQLLAVTRFETQRVFAETPTTFFTEDMEHWGTFTRNSAGRVDGMIWYREAGQETLKRID